MSDKESERVYSKVVKVCGAVRGDIDDNKFVDLADAILALRVLSGISGVSLNLSSDVNGDNRIGMEETVYILQYVAVLR